MGQIVGLQRVGVGEGFSRQITNPSDYLNISNDCGNGLQKIFLHGSLDAHMAVNIDTPGRRLHDLRINLGRREVDVDPVVPHFSVVRIHRLVYDP